MAWNNRKKIFDSMKPEDRIATIKNFVEGHRYLVGVKYRVLYDEPTDRITVDFESIGETQLWSFRGSLRAHELDHIQLTYQELVPMDQKPKRKQSRWSGSYRKRRNDG